MLSSLSVSDEERAYLAALRPSRIREVQAGRSGWTCVDLIDTDGSEAVALRGLLELFGVYVHLFRVGQARHLVSALGGEATAPYVVVACHGDAGRVLLPDLAEEIERFQPLHGSVGPDDWRQFAGLPGSVVISTGCETGTSALASAFAPLLLFYELTEGRFLAHAVERLQAHDRELSMWRLFRP